METEFSGSYAEEDVTFLLRRLVLAPTPLAEREQSIQSGRRHYSEMIGDEDAPKRERMRLFRECLLLNGKRFAADLTAMADTLAATSSDRPLILVSIARAGTPIGVIVRRLILRRQAWPAEAVRHFSISVIRDRGADLHALRFILARYGAANLRFLDGWTGKGTIAKELRASLASAPDLAAVSPGLWVPLDVFGCAEWAAGEDDYLIPSALLGGTLSGLISRSILLREDCGRPEFHGCVDLQHLRRYDLSRWFAGVVEEFGASLPPSHGCASRGSGPARSASAEQYIKALACEFGITDRNKVKLGMGEAVRVALRRHPERILIRDAASPDAALLIRLAGLRGIQVSLRPEMPFAAAALIGVFPKAS